MSFPTTLDTTTTIPVEVDTTPTITNHVANHTAMRTAIIAIETLLGVTASAVAGTFNYILGEITGSDKAVGKSAAQVISNKTLGTGTKMALGSDATGDTYYNSGSGILGRIAAGPNGYIYKLVAGIPAWVAETVTVFMSTTVAGIGEIATSAEITAGTATGGTGGPLVVTPDALAASSPTFNGINITNLPAFVYNATASNNLKLSADTQQLGAQDFGAAHYDLRKEIRVNYGGTVRVKYDIAGTGGNGITGNLYLNGVSLGLSTGSSTQSPTYTTISNDITIQPGDRVQFYMGLGGGNSGYVQNFRIYFDKTFSSADGTVITN